IEVRIGGQQLLPRGTVLDARGRALPRKRRVVQRVDREPPEELTAPEVLLVDVTRIADAQRERAPGLAHAETVLAPGGQLAADGELERRLAQLRFGHALVADEHVELVRLDV